MTTAPTYPPPYLPERVDNVVPGIRQGVDVMVPMTLELPAGATDASVLDFAVTDKATFAVSQVSVKSDGGYKTERKFELAREAGSIVLIPGTRTIELHINNTLTTPCKPDADGQIQLYGTLLIEDNSGRSRPCSGPNLYLPVTPSWL